MRPHANKNKGPQPYSPPLVWQVVGWLAILGAALMAAWTPNIGN